MNLLLEVSTYDFSDISKYLFLVVTIIHVAKNVSTLLYKYYLLLLPSKCYIYITRYYIGTNLITNDKNK